MGLKIKPRMNTNEHEEICQKTFPQMAQIGISRENLSAKICAICGRVSTREIKIRAAHKIMAARTTQFALLVDQLMPTLQAKPPVLAGNILGRSKTGILTKIVRKI
jgi:hypothetical protein